MARNDVTHLAGNAADCSREVISLQRLHIPHLPTQDGVSTGAARSLFPAAQQKIKCDRTSKVSIYKSSRRNSAIASCRVE